MSKEVIILDSKDKGNLKGAIAKCLYKKGYEQTKIANILGLTQAMVSKLISSGDKVNRKAGGAAFAVIEKIKKGKRPNFYTTVAFEKVEEGRYFLAHQNELINDSKQKIIENLSRAFTILKGKDVNKILPEVKMNIVMGGDRKEDVGSFSNGLLVINDKVALFSEIVFGKSKHLAELLIYLKKKDTKINSIMNIKYDERLRGQELSKDYKINELMSDILLHRGAHGIEPCAYVLGKDAVDVANRVKGMLT